MEFNLYFIKFYLNYYYFQKFGTLNCYLFRINQKEKEKATVPLGH
jgi:hypothetical protein